MNFLSCDPFCRAIYNREFLTLNYDIERVDIDGHVLKLMVVKAFDVEAVVTDRPFMDYLEPVGPESGAAVRRGTWYAPRVCLAYTNFEKETAKRDAKRDGHDEKIATPDGYTHIAPFADLKYFDGYDGYVEHQLAGKRFKDDERRLRQFKKDVGEVVFTVDDPQGLEQAFEWKRQQFPGNRDFARPNLAFLQALRPHLTVSTLRHDGVLLAAWVGFIHETEGAPLPGDKRWGGWIYSYNPAPEYHKFSFGRQLLYFMAEEAFARGCTELDFSIGGEAYKKLFCNRARLIGPIGRKTLAQRAMGRVATVLR